VLATIGLLELWLVRSHANEPAAPVPEHLDLFAERIEIIAMSCAACHGTDGRLRTAIPALAGRPAALLEMQLQNFKYDRAPIATVMPRIVKAYTDEEIKGLASHFSGLQP
jgi:cytochrome subunit of sulfide dehydrogenase